MFSQYLDKAMERAQYELDESTFIATIPGFQGLWGYGPTIELCRADLKDALEGWLVLGLWQNDESIPKLGKLSLIPRRVRIREKYAAAAPNRSYKAS